MINYLTIDYKDGKLTAEDYCDCCAGCRGITKEQLFLHIQDLKEELEKAESILKELD